MYLVMLYDGPDDSTPTVINSPYSGGVKLSSGQLKLKLSGIDEFHFSFNPDNPAFNQVKPRKTLIKIYDARDNRKVFDGRVLRPNFAMADSGLHTQSFDAESRLAYLYDSSQRWAEVHNITVTNLLKKMLDQHNAVVEPYKRFKLGKVTVTDPNDSLYRYFAYDTTYANLKDKLLDKLGGFFVVRDGDDGTYLDYLAEVGNHNTETISIGKNLVSVNRQEQQDTIITRLVPVGADIESNDPNNTQASHPKLTISTVNGGKDYIDDTALQAEYGVVEGVQEFTDIHVASELLTAGKSFIAAQAPVVESWTIAALDLSYLSGSNHAPFLVGDYYPFRDAGISDVEELQIIELDVDIQKPQKPNLTIGEKRRRVSQFAASAARLKSTISQLQARVSAQETQYSELSAAAKATNDSLKVLQDSYDTLIKTIGDADLTAIAGQLTALKNQTTTVITNLGEIGAEVLANQSAISKLKVADAELDRRITALESPTGGTTNE